MSKLEGRLAAPGRMHFVPMMQSLRRTRARGAFEQMMASGAAYPDKPWKIQRKRTSGPGIFQCMNCSRFSMNVGGRRPQITATTTEKPDHISDDQGHNNNRDHRYNAHCQPFAVRFTPHRTPDRSLDLLSCFFSPHKLHYFLPTS